MMGFCNTFDKMELLMTTTTTTTTTTTKVQFILRQNENMVITMSITIGYCGFCDRL